MASFIHSVLLFKDSCMWSGALDVRLVIEQSSFVWVVQDSFSRFVVTLTLSGLESR